MNFTKAESNQNFPAGRWVSENQIWEIGFLPVMYGVRVKVSLVGSNWVTLNYCAGADKEFALILLATVTQILMALPESITEDEIHRLFPKFEIKPIDRDPYCWERLKELAAQAKQGYAIAI
jgi:hypothetical protein